MNFIVLVDFIYAMFTEQGIREAKQATFILWMIPDSVTKAVHVLNRLLWHELA